MNGNPRTDEAPQEAPPQEAQPQDAVFPPGPPANARDAAEVARLTAELDAARRRVDQLARAYQELEKDREEFKQRLTRERERMLDVERGKVATHLFEAVDELDLCLSKIGR